MGSFTFVFLQQVKSCASVPCLYFKKSQECTSISNLSGCCVLFYTKPFSASMLAALSIALLLMLLPVLTRRGFFILSHCRSHYSVPNHYQGPTTISIPHTSTSELCLILSFLRASFQSWINILAPVLWPSAPPLTSVWARWSLGLCYSHTKLSSSSLARICVHTVHRFLLTLLTD